MVQVKGAAIAARRAFVVEEFGDQAWDRVLAELPAEDAEVLRGVVLSSSWYPFGLNERLDEAIAQTVGGGDLAVFERIGARSATTNLKGPHAAFLAAGDPERFLGATEAIYKFYYDTGHRTYEATGPDSGVITTHDAETFSRPDCLTVIGWYKEALRMCGARRVEIVEETCRADGDEHCRYRVRWS
jgi:uncharacterized protein (TIGR02265 family)